MLARKCRYPLSDLCRLAMLGFVGKLELLHCEALLTPPHPENLGAVSGITLALTCMEVPPTLVN